MKDALQTDPLRALRLKVDRPGHGYTPFQAKKRMELLRRNFVKRHTEEQARLDIHERIRRAQAQEALRSERVVELPVELFSTNSHHLLSAAEHLAAYVDALD